MLERWILSPRGAARPATGDHNQSTLLILVRGRSENAVAFEMSQTRKHSQERHVPATLVELQVEGGLPVLRCPVTGKTVYDDEDGFQPEHDHGPYLRFFCDWVGNTWVADVESLPEEARGLQERLVEILGSTDDGESQSQNEIMAQICEVMPSSAVVFEVLDPPRGSFDGTIAYAAFDFANVNGDQEFQPRFVELTET
jgi:hypothetical protein